MGVETTGGSTVGYRSLFDRALRWGLGLHSGGDHPTLPKDGIVGAVIIGLHLGGFGDPLTEGGLVDVVAMGLHPRRDGGSLPEDGA